MISIDGNGNDNDIDGDKLNNNDEKDGIGFNPAPSTGSEVHPELPEMLIVTSELKKVGQR